MCCQHFKPSALPVVIPLNNCGSNKGLGVCHRNLEVTDRSIAHGKLRLCGLWIAVFGGREPDVGPSPLRNYKARSHDARITFGVRIVIEILLHSVARKQTEDGEWKAE